MPALIPTAFAAPHRLARPGARPRRVAALTAPRGDRRGLRGLRRGGAWRPDAVVCSRVTGLHPKGTEIRNARQIAIVSAEEMAEVAARMGLESFDPAWSGASVVIEGLPDFSRLPPSSRLQAPDGTTLVVDMENRPCHLPARVIDEDAPGLGPRLQGEREGSARRDGVGRARGDAASG